MSESLACCNAGTRSDLPAAKRRSTWMFLATTGARASICSGSVCAATQTVSLPYREHPRVEEVVHKGRGRRADKSVDDVAILHEQDRRRRPGAAMLGFPASTSLQASPSDTRTPSNVTQDLNRTRNAPSGCYLSQR